MDRRWALETEGQVLLQRVIRDQVILMLARGESFSTTTRVRRSHASIASAAPVVTARISR